MRKKFRSAHLHWLADIIAATVILSVVAIITIVVMGFNDGGLQPVTASFFGLYAFVVLMSCTKLYGKSVYEAVKSVGQGLLPRASSGNNQRRDRQ